MSDDDVAVVRCGNFVVEPQKCNDPSLTMIGVRHLVTRSQVRLLASEAPSLVAAMQRFVGPNGVLGPDESLATAMEQWTQIGAMCSAGRRSLWVRFEMSDPDSLIYTDQAVRCIHARAGREGDDVTMTIGHDNPQFSELLELFLTAKFAAET